MLLHAMVHSIMYHHTHFYLLVLLHTDKVDPLCIVHGHNSVGIDPLNRITSNVHYTHNVAHTYPKAGYLIGNSTLLQDLKLEATLIII